jgi:hypothetical protein
VKGVVGVEVRGDSKTEDLCRTYGAQRGLAAYPALAGWVNV